MNFSKSDSITEARPDAKVRLSAKMGSKLREGPELGEN